MPRHLPIKRSVNSLTAEEAADLAARYPHEPSTALAAEFALSLSQISNFAFSRKLHKTPEGYRANRRPVDCLTADVERVTLDAGPHGLDAEGIQRAVRALIDADQGARAYVTAHQIRVARRKLVEQQRIHLVIFSAAKSDQRWYGKVEWATTAAAATAGHHAITGTARETRAANFATMHDRRRGRQADEAAARRKHLDAPTNNPAGIQPQVLPGAPESRWAHLKVTEPTFSSRRPGEYLDTDPPAWVRAACHMPADVCPTTPFQAAAGPDPHSRIDCTQGFQRHRPFLHPLREHMT